VKNAEILYLIICRPPIIDFAKVAVIKNYGLLFCATLIHEVAKVEERFTVKGFSYRVKKD
jgi:hypothetical protein